LLSLAANPCEDGGVRRPDQQRAPRIRPPRRLERGGVQSLRNTIPSGRDSARTARRGDSAHQAVMDGREDLFRGEVLSAGKRRLRPEAGATTLEDVARRRGREEALANRGRARRRLEHGLRPAASRRQAKGRSAQTTL